MLATEPVSVQLRYLQTLTEIGVEKNTTVIFPVPVDFFSGLQNFLAAKSERRGSQELRGNEAAMTKAASEDTEITLGTGKMLALFFGLVALCAVFFAMGFSLGRTSGLKPSAAEAAPPAVTAAAMSAPRRSNPPFPPPT